VDVPFTQAGEGGANLGLYSDPLGTQTCATVAPGTAATLYLIATLGDHAATGVTVAEFRLVVTNPAGYLFNYIPPANVPIVLGNPLDLDPASDDVVSGANVAYSSCQTGERVAFGTLQVFNISGGPTEIRVERRQPSSPLILVCPLFAQCGPFYETFCMRACDFNASGSAISGRCGLNEPDCAPPGECPSDCPGAPCLTIGTTTVSSPRCVGSPITVTTTVSNCGSTPADVDVFIEEVLAGSFTGVAPGANVMASRTYTLQACGDGSSGIAVGALATNAACDRPVGVEREFGDACSQTCTNQPPDCSNATLSVTSLWPPDGQMVDVEIGGIMDPDGDPITIRDIFVESDEPSGIEGSATCPDVLIDSSTHLRMRAERSSTGDGRVYRVAFNVFDPGGNLCQARVSVCVPRKPGDACAPPARFPYVPTTCADPFDDRARNAVLAMAVSGGVEVHFEHDGETDARVEVYDVRGRRLMQLADGRFAAGRHVLRWDGHDADGGAVANGIYIVRVVAGGRATSAKVVLVR